MIPELFNIQPFTRQELSALTNSRKGETRLGEKVSTEPNSKTKFIIIGIEESIGPLANKGFSGAEKAFIPFLQRFLNMQSNRFLSGEEICIFGSIKQMTNKIAPDLFSAAVDQLDQVVSDIISSSIKKEHILIIIGGGHNNAYPIISSINKILKQKLHVLNLDPHGDCRALEGRHSGNPFSYAMAKDILESYSVIGLHKAYNNEETLDFLNKHHCKYSFYDDIVNGKSSFEEQLNDFIRHLKYKNPLGLELDMDAIAFSPSSAFTPSGINPEEARNYICRCSNELKPVYLHLPEAAPLNEIEEKISGKLLAYLTYDFIVNHSVTQDKLKN